MRKKLSAMVTIALIVAAGSSRGRSGPLARADDRDPEKAVDAALSQLANPDRGVVPPPPARSTDSGATPSRKCKSEPCSTVGCSSRMRTFARTSARCSPRLPECRTHRGRVPSGAG